MKKLAIMAVLAVAAISASAVEVGVRGVVTGRDSSPDMVGVTVGQSFGKLGAEAAFDRSTRGTGSVNRWSLVVSYPVAKVAGATVSLKGGYAIVDPSVGSNGGAFLAGAGVAYPVAKNVSLVADYTYQYGQDRVAAFSGNQVSAGVKFAF